MTVTTIIFLFIISVAAGDVNTDGSPSDIGKVSIPMPDGTDLAWCEAHKGEFTTTIPANTIMFGSKCIEIKLLPGGPV